MNKIKLIGIFCIFLIVSLPIAFAQAIAQPPAQNPYVDSYGNPLAGYTKDQYGRIIDSRTGQIVYSASGYNPGGITGSLDPRNYPSGVNDPRYIQDYYQRYGTYPPGYSGTNQPGFNPQTGYYSGSSQTGYGQQTPQYLPSYLTRDGKLAQGYTINKNTGDIMDQNGRVVASKAEVERIGGSINVGAGEINFAYIGPTSGDQLRLGTSTGNLILNVNRYEPTVLTANLVEEQTVPVYAFLSGSIATAPGIAPKISYMDVNVIGGDVQYVAGKPRFNPPILYTLEDLGYIETWLQRIPKESQVPNKIDLTLQARVQFEGDSTVPIFGGEERKILQENRKRDIFQAGGFADQDLRIFGGRAYVRAKYITDTRASFDVYSDNGVYIGEVSASSGQETYPVSIVPGSSFIGDQLRIRVERILGGNQDSVKFNINGKDYVFNRGQEIQVEQTVAGEDKRIKPTGWIVQDMFIPSVGTSLPGGITTPPSGSTAPPVVPPATQPPQPQTRPDPDMIVRVQPPNLGHSFLVLRQGSFQPGYSGYGTQSGYGSLGSSGFPGYSGSGFLGNIGSSGYIPGGGSFGSSLVAGGDMILLVYHGDGRTMSKQQLLDWYGSILNNENNYNALKNCGTVDVNTLRSLGIYDTAACRFVSGILINMGKNKEEILKKATDLIESIKIDFGTNEIPSFTLEKGSGIKAVLRVGGSAIPFKEGDELRGGGSTPSCTDQRASYYCKVKSIQDDRVTITHYENNPNTGTCVGIDEPLFLNSGTLNQRYDTYTNPIGGTQNIPTSPGQGILYQTGTNKCGGYVDLVDISTGRSVEVTILAGPPRGYAESVFNLHIPIEKRAINLSVDELDEKINSTKKMIEDLTSIIDKLEKFVSAWMKVCLAISAWFTIEAFLVGLPKYKKDSSLAQADYNAQFKYNNQNEGFYTYDNYQKAKQVKDGKIDQSKLENRIEGIDNGGFYYTGKGKDGKSTKELLENTGVLYNQKGEEYEYDYFQKKMVPVAPMRDKGEIQVFTGGDGKKRLVITTDDLDSTNHFLRGYTGTAPIPSIEKYRQKYGNKGYYLVFEEGDSLQMWHKSGNNVDFNTLQLGQNELRDQVVTEFSKTGGSAAGSMVYRGVEQNLQVLREAQLRGQSRVRFGGTNFQLNDRGRLDKTKTKCEDILGEGKCKLLFNACDPVVCPRSRCNLGGQYYATGPGGVIGSGLVGSLLLCLPNIKDGVIVPICLSGILASLKGIRSHLQSYVKCLEASKTGQVSIGICDQIRSIFICEIIWKEGLMLLNAKAGLINLVGSQAGGGGEYFIQGIGGSVQEANEVVSFIVNDYADDVLAAYKGKGLPEIGAEVCKASIAQRIPFIDALLGEASTPPDPPQFTAHFEETPYAPTLGKSKYQVYFHVYAGTPQREQALNWMVYLKSFGSSPMLRVGAGTLPPGESADQTIDVIGDKGYQQICVVLNGVEQCGFGKTVSSDMFLNTLNDYITSQELGANIQSAAQCKSDPTSVVSTVGNRGILPGGPSVRRGCFASNPGIGIGQEKFWRKVGGCGSDKQGVSLGDCYEYADWQRYPGIENQVLDLSCGATNVCKLTQVCKGGRITTSFQTSSGEFCCEGGSCADKAYVGEINNMAASLTSGLSESDKLVVDDTIRRDWSGGDIGTVGSSSGRAVFRGPNGEEARYYAVLQICSGNVLPGKVTAGLNNAALACQEVVNSVPATSKYYASAHYILATIYDPKYNTEGNLGLAKKEYEIVNNVMGKSDLTPDQIATARGRLSDINNELSKKPLEEKKKIDYQNRINTVDSIGTTINTMINSYKSFSDVESTLTKINEIYSTLRNTAKTQDLSSTYIDALTKITNELVSLDITKDKEYLLVINLLNTAKSKQSNKEIKETIGGAISIMNTWSISLDQSFISDLVTIQNRVGDVDNADLRNDAATKLNDYINKKLPQLQIPFDNLKGEFKKLNDEVSRLPVSNK